MRKRGTDGKVETYKTHLVAKGHRQHYGIDYDETFSPVIMLKSIQIMLAIAAHLDNKIWQMDVKTAFLNGELEKEVCMIQPEGFTSTDELKVCKLKRSIYGLKQVFRSWNMHFDKVIKHMGSLRMEKSLASTSGFLIL